MVIRRVALTIVTALALGSTGLVTGTASAATGGGGSGQFHDPSRVNAAGSCSNDPGVSNTEIKVGAILPQSGPTAASFSDSEKGMRARFDQANSSGELGNRKI